MSEEFSSVPFFQSNVNFILLIHPFDFPHLQRSTHVLSFKLDVRTNRFVYHLSKFAMAKTTASMGVMNLDAKRKDLATTQSLNVLMA